MPVPFARPGHEVLSIVPGDVGSGRSKMPAVASAESEPERICREMGTLGEAGVPVTVDSVWRRLAQASSPAIHGTLPCGAEPSRKEQPLAVPRRAGQTEAPSAASDSLQGAAWRASEVLSPPCRLSILTNRGVVIFHSTRAPAQFAPYLLSIRENTRVVSDLPSCAARCPRQSLVRDIPFR